MNIKEALIGLSMLMYTSCGITNCGNPEPRYESSVPQIQTSEFELLILQSEQPVVVDFYADWCPSCQSFERPYEETARAMSSQADFIRYDTDQLGTREHIEIMERYQIEFIPTVIVFREGNTICRPDTTTDAEQFQRSIEACLE